MKRRRLRRALLGVGLVAAVAAGTVLAVIALTGSARELVQVPGSEGEANMPPALAAHLEELAKAIPGNGGESTEGPASAAADEFFKRAYPDTDIPLARVTTARADFAEITQRGFPSVRSTTGTWVPVGPSTALYPFFEFRDIGLYVPNEYVAGGRTTAMAIAPSCTKASCRLYIAAAGGGIWRTDNALKGNPDWSYLSGTFGINSIGEITLDPNDPSGNTVWIGTGEGNTCGSGCVSGVGLYRSTDGGDTWTGPIGESAFRGRGVGSIAIEPGDPNTIYAASSMALLGHSSVCCNGLQRIVIPGAALWGLYRSTNGGATWTYIHNGAATTAECGTDIAAIAANATPCTPRGMRRVLIDPVDPNTVYAASYARGVWRSSDGGDTWEQIKPSLSPITTTRPEIAVTELPNGDTRMYVGEGHTGAGGQYSRLFRSEDVRDGSPSFVDLTSANPANAGYGSFDYCGGQCWYDNLVYTPHGHPDIVYVGGSYQYGESGGISNGRGVVLSTDAGVSFTDVTADATDPLHPNALHPDQHALVTVPGNPYRFLEGSDGGIARSNGKLADISGNCDARALPPVQLARCKQLLSRVPEVLKGINRGLSTLQFQSLTVNPRDVDDLQGGTQDNGTWESYGNTKKWLNTMIGDGGQSGFDATVPEFRFHTFFAQQVDVNFSNGAVADWNWISDPLFNGEGAAFYVPVISDPTVSGTMFIGTGHVWRTKTHGMGSMTLAELRQHCNEWTGDFAVTCGDWEPLGNPGADGQLVAASFGDRAGGVVAAVERAPSNSSTLWAATSAGRVFVSTNGDADPASAVAFTRIDSLSTRAPNRFVSGIAVDPANPNHAWLSYSGFSSATPLTPGHVFSVTFNPAAGTATWRSLDRPSSTTALGDLPITDIAFDDVTGDLYVSNDFGVLIREADDPAWKLAAPGMPNVEVPGLTIVPSERKLYAATHGLSAWLLDLPES